MDEENLTQAMIEQLLRYMPDQETLNQFASMKEEYNSLAEAEQFCVNVSYCNQNLMFLLEVGFLQDLHKVVCFLENDKMQSQFISVSQSTSVLH